MKSYRVRESLNEDLATHLMIARGIAQEEHEDFLHPDFERDSHDPFLLPDMGPAVERILAARTLGEQVCVWSDYDCDGIPGGVLLAEFLRFLGLTVTHHIPHRHKEGYGLNVEGVGELARQGVTLIITVDLGSSDTESIAFAKTKGIDVLVTDHHLVQELPPALAVINPKRPDSRYPFDGLCGAGVAWKLVQGILQSGKAPLRQGYAGQEKWLLDLVGIATLSDMVPLRGENRMLARFGLTVLRRARRPGIAALLELLRIKPSTLTEDDVGFMLSPRINAASRMDSPELAARLLSSAERGEARELARQLDCINNERKGLVAATVKEANKRLALGVESPIIVMGSPAWRPGILGLVAGSLSQTHGKPVFLWGREGGEAVRGSARLPGGKADVGDDTSVVELMQAAGDVFVEFGGHRASGGFSVLEERVHELPAALASAYETVKAKSARVAEVVIDRELTLAETPQVLRVIDRLPPFGIGNEKPLFVFPRVSVAGMRVFGKGQDHLELSLADDAERISGVAFFSAPESFSKKIEQGDRADIVGNVERDWRGHPRIRVIDIL